MAFWPILVKDLVNSFNYAHNYGELSNSQKQAVITLVEKKGKDKRLIKNWRPISLINVDTKIVSKTLAKRLEHILPDLIHYNQNAYVKGDRSLMLSGLLMMYKNTQNKVRSLVLW